jgi:hypothetical protein
MNKLNNVRFSLWTLLEDSFKKELFESGIYCITDKEWENL